MRLIDADALKEVFNQHEDNKGYLIGDWEEYIDNAPTVEQSYQEPKDYIRNKLDYSRPQGEWITESKLYGGYGDGVLVNTCSVCKTSFIYRGKAQNFCSNCGADMRGEQ